MKITSILVLTLMLAAKHAYGDSWLEAHPLTAASPDGATIVRVEPGRNNEHARARIFVLSGDQRSFVEQRSFVLRNEYCPMQVTITNNGQWVATVDNWGELGYGELVIAVYDAQGLCVKTWSLEDIFSKQEIGNFLKTSSSRHWAGSISVRESVGDSPTLYVLPYRDLDQPREAPFRAILLKFTDLKLSKL